MLTITRKRRKPGSLWVLWGASIASRKHLSWRVGSRQSYTPEEVAHHVGWPTWRKAEESLGSEDAKMRMRLMNPRFAGKKSLSWLRKRFHTSRLKFKSKIYPKTSKNESDFAQSSFWLCTFVSSVSTCSWSPPGWTWRRDDVAMTRRGRSLSCRRPRSLPLEANGERSSKMPLRIVAAMKSYEVLHTAFGYIILYQL